MAGPEHLWTDTISILRFLSFDAEGGDPTYATSLESHPARVEKKRKTSTNSAGKRVDSAHDVQTGVEIFEGDLVWVPGTDTSNRDDALHLVSSHEASPPDKHFTMFEYVIGK